MYKDRGIWDYCNQVKFTINVGDFKIIKFTDVMFRKGHNQLFSYINSLTQSFLNHHSIMTKSKHLCFWSIQNI